MSAGNGEPGENDQITQAEDVHGGRASDILLGDERDNRLEAFTGGSATLIGGPGADFLIGGSRNDFLDASSGFFPPVDDGAKDKLFGLDGVDTCVFRTVDPDFASECE